MNKDKIIFIAVDLGSTNIRIMAAQRNEKCLLDVLAVEKIETPTDFIKDGVIKKPTEVATKLRELFSLMQNRLEIILHKKYTIKGFYISVSGRSLRTKRGYVKRTFADGTEISNVELKAFENQLRHEQEMDGYVIYDIFNEEFLIDGNLVKTAKGQVCKDIRSNYLIVLGKQDISANLDKCLSRLAMPEVKGKELSPIAIADAVMTEDDKDKGCAVINFGGNTTTLSVYQGGYLRHMAVIPFGGEHMTHDLEMLNLSYKNAEALKKDHITFDINKLNKTQRLKISNNPGEDSIILTLQEVYDYLEARLSEIIDFCFKEIKKSSMSDKLQNGIIITGGGSKLKGITEYLSTKTKLPVRIGHHDSLLSKSSIEKYSGGEYSLLIGLLSKANENCVDTKGKINIPIPKRSGIIKELFESSMFDDRENTITE